MIVTKACQTQNRLELRDQKGDTNNTIAQSGHSLQVTMHPSTAFLTARVPSYRTPFQVFAGFNQQIPEGALRDLSFSETCTPFQAFAGFNQQILEGPLRSTASLAACVPR